jgi:hypothetical protein
MNENYYNKGYYVFNSKTEYWEYSMYIIIGNFILNFEFFILVLVVLSYRSIDLTMIGTLVWIGYFDWICVKSVKCSNHVPVKYEFFLIQNQVL